MNPNVTRRVNAWLTGRLLEKCGLIHRAWRWKGSPVRRSDVSIRFLTGGLLITASAFKGYGIFATGKAMNLRELPTWITLSLLLVEVMLGLALIAGLWSRPVRISTLTLFSGFACYSLRAAVEGRHSCGCFGQAVISPWIMFIVDVLAIAFLLWWRPKTNRPAESVELASERNADLPSLAGRASFVRPRFLATLIPCMMIGLPAGWLASPHRGLSSEGQVGEIFVAEPEKWINQELPLVPNIDIGQELLKGDWIVLLYHHDCPKCQDALAQYERDWQRFDPSAPRLAMIEVPPCGPNISPGDSVYRHGRLDDSRMWFVETPTHLLVSAGVVRVVSHEVLDPANLVDQSAAVGAVRSLSENYANR